MRAGGGKTRAIRVLIVDDEDMFVELVKAVVAVDDRIEVVGRASNGREAVELAGSLRPDVTVMDIEMPLMDGIEATRRIRGEDAAARVVIFTGSDQPRDEQRARDAGAVAFVRKAHISALLLDAIRHTAERDDATSRPVRMVGRLQAVLAAG
jgi:DNA-binding NarL/FixJ family response regulator